MAKSSAFANAHLLLVFNNTNIALVGDATGYARVAVARTSGGFVVTGNAAV